LRFGFGAISDFGTAKSRRVNSFMRSIFSKAEGSGEGRAGALGVFSFIAASFCRAGAAA